MHEILADAFFEINATKIEALKLQEALILAKQNPKMLTDAWGWITVQGFASAIEKIYAGCERALDVVAKQIDLEPIKRGPAWHRDLLERMKQPFKAARPLVLTQQTAEALDVLRSFRHRARNTYGSVLDVDRVLEIAAEAINTPALVEGDLVMLRDILLIRKV